MWISLPDKPGQLGNVSSLIGEHKLNISNLEMAGKNPNYINFKFQLIIRDLKNFTNFIAELKQKGIKFKIIRPEDNTKCPSKRASVFFKIFKDFLSESISFIFVSNYLKFYTFLF